MITLKINGVDAYTAYGLRLSKGALEALMTPPPAKARIEGKTRLRNGTSIITPSSLEFADDRTISLPVHFCAKNEVSFLQRYDAFCNVLRGGILDLEIVINVEGIPSFRKYTLYYQSCTQYSQFYGGIAKFVLKVHEPNP